MKNKYVRKERMRRERKQGGSDKAVSLRDLQLAKAAAARRKQNERS